MHGYRLSENAFTYMVAYDDSFLNPSTSPGLQESYYGAACFPRKPDKGDQTVLCRGNVVIWKVFVKNKRRVALPKPTNFMDQMFASFSHSEDDADLQYDYDIYPVSKAEVAHLLTERRNAIDSKSSNVRVWRGHIRSLERNVELTKQSGGKPSLSLG